ncbi:hypothetical protein ABZ897_00690 [Nonomuraea sp. NPDC046802]|uniref:hypothetical protein n=1 Tax=Nonomuraea sp. NPDC046802 TaxID=3154919 RepID=UPI003405FB26
MADDREQREQIAWQLRANQLLTDLLREQNTGGLRPVLRWTIQSAGCLLFGEPPMVGDNAGKAAAVRAWADRLGLQVRETPMSHGDVRVTAHGIHERVKVAVCTTLRGDEEETAHGA